MQGYRRMKKMFIAAIAVLVLIPTAAFSAEDTAGKIAAKINDRSISMQEFEHEVDNYMMRYQGGRAGTLPPAMVQQIRAQAINTLINREVLLQESEKKGITADKQKVQEGIQAIQKRFANPEQFEEALKNMKLSRGDLEKQYTQKTKIEALLDQQIVSKITVKEDEAKAYFNDHIDEFSQKAQIRARHILIKVDKSADEKKKAEAREQLVKVQKKIMAGEDFSELAKQYSQGPSSVKGGDLGYFGKGQMVKPFEEVAFKLAPNEVSDIVETRFGYHLIKVVDRKAEKKAVFAESKERVTEKLKNQRIQQEVGAYIQQLRNKATIENLIQ